jgi:hypothetical protein
VVLAIDFEPFSVGNSTLQLLIVLAALTLLCGAVIVLGTHLAGPLVDRRWPADEPLDPTEMLWGEAGGYIQRHFKGLDLGESRELASQFTEARVPAGRLIIEQGDPADFFFVLKEGEAEVVQRIERGGMVQESTIRRYGPGDSFGEVAILRRTTRTARVQALTDCVVLRLPAEDFAAGAALSAAEESMILGRVDEYLAADRARAAQAAAGRSVSAGPSVGWRPSHVVPATGLPAWDRPDPAAPPSATLAAGTEVRVLEETGVWRRVATATGWQGWVDGRTLVPRS